MKYLVVYRDVNGMEKYIPFHEEKDAISFLQKSVRCSDSYLYRMTHYATAEVTVEKVND